MSAARWALNPAHGGLARVSLAIAAAKSGVRLSSKSAALFNSLLRSVGPVADQDSKEDEAASIVFNAAVTEDGDVDRPRLAVRNGEVVHRDKTDWETTRLSIVGSVWVSDGAGRIEVELEGVDDERSTRILRSSRSRNF